MPDPSRLVTAVVPNYNDAATLGEALEALLSQSYRDLEVIVVDDASTDNSLDVIAEIAKRDPRVKLVRHERNMGPIVAQLTGFQRASGEYLFCPSANDKVLPGFVESLVRLLDIHSQAGIAVCELLYVDDPTARDAAGLSRDPAYVWPGQLVEVLAKRVFLIGGAASLVRRADWAAAGWLIPELHWMADYFAMHVVAFRKGLCYVPARLYALRTPVYSQTGPRSAAQRAATECLLRLLESEQYADVRASFIRSGILASVPGLFRLVVANRRFWSFLSPALVRRSLWEEAKSLVRPVTPARPKRAYRRIRDALTSRPLFRGNES